MKKLSPSITFFILLAGANLGLLFAPLTPLTAIALTLLLPGWGWVRWLFPHQRRLSRLALALGLGYAVATLGTLILHYLPGGIAEWQLLALLNALALAPFLHPRARRADTPVPAEKITTAAIGFALVILLAIGLRFADLGYSEFQGDEALAMISAAEAIQGHADALFLRGKGPGEILLPAAVWTLTGTITEGVARVPFAIAGVMGLLTLYLLAKDLFSTRTARYATAILAAGGLLVGFSRIVQYQTIVVWMSLLSLWTFWHWQREKQWRWLLLSGIFLGIGLLAHYDAILVAPAIGWVWLSGVKKDLRRSLLGGMGWGVTALGTAAIFYAPYLLDPQISRTGDYVSGRIGAGLKNHLADFLNFNAFYSSFYFVLIAGLLLVGFLGWAVFHHKEGKWWTIFSVATLLMLAVTPNWLGQWTVLPVAAILLAAFASPALDTAKRTALVYFAVPFLGYNFAVATPLTHIYTVLPGWALLAGWAAAQIRLERRAVWGVNLALVLISSLYLWNAFVNHSHNFVRDYPAGNIALFRTPEIPKPQTGFFGFPHKTGWKSVGALIATGTLNGDYESNEEEDVTGWYTRHAPRACNPGAEFRFVAAELVDATPLAPPPAPLVEIGSVMNAAGKPTLSIFQRTPTPLDLGELNRAALERQFNQTATPAAFAREARPDVVTDINFGGKIKLVGYSLNARRSYPGGRVVVTLFWQAQQSLREQYKVFVHLDSEKKYAQADSVPVCARFPTTDWRVGQTIADTHALDISPDTPLTDLPLVVGLYQPDTGARLDVLDVAGNPAGVSATLTTIGMLPAPKGDK